MDKVDPLTKKENAESSSSEGAEEDIEQRLAQMSDLEKMRTLQDEYILPKAQEILEMGLGFAHQFYVLGPKYSVFVLTGENDSITWKQKKDFRRSFARACILVGARAIADVCEVWTLPPDEKDHTIRPAEHPHRHEALQCIIATQDGKRESRTLPFARDNDGHITWGEELHTDGWESVHWEPFYTRTVYEGEIEAHWRMDLYLKKVLEKALNDGISLSSFFLKGFSLPSLVYREDEKDSF